MPGFEVAGRVAGTSERVAGLCRPPTGGVRATHPADRPAAGPGHDEHHRRRRDAGHPPDHLALHRRAGLRPGETVLVPAGAGRVGSATIQLAKVAGSRVIATASGADKIALAGRARRL